MNRIILFFVILFYVCVESSNAQLRKVIDSIMVDYNTKYIVEGVAGCRFGEGKNDVVLKLKDRFGAPLERTSTKDILFHNIWISDIHFDYGKFYFSLNENNEEQFSAADLVLYYSKDKLKEAKKKRDEIALVYKKKYKNLKGQIPSVGFKKYFCGSKEDNKYPICISLQKQNLRGSLMYAVVVSYFESQQMASPLEF